MNTRRPKKKLSIQWMTGTAMMLALEFVLASTPLGMIRMPFLTATTLHIPTIIATLVLGLRSGMLVGLAFGVISLVSNLTGASFFAPFFINPLVSVLPRMIFPAGVYWIARGAGGLLKKTRRGRAIACIVASALGTALHTAMVMGMIYLLYADQITQMIAANASAPQALIERGVGMGVAVVGAANGVPEMLVAAVIAPVVSLALDKALGRMKK